MLITDITININNVVISITPGLVINIFEVREDNP